MSMPKPGLPTIQANNLVNQIACILTEALLKGDFAPGERLSEAQLARDLGVSRAPVREAARLLESRGLVISQPRKGFFVRSFTVADLGDLYDLRLCLERHVVRQLAGRLTPEITEQLKAQVGRMRHLAIHGSAEEQVEEDLHFHRMLCVFCGNRRLLRVYDELAHELRFGILMVGRLYEDPLRIAETHQPVIDALISRNVQTCEAAIHEHISVAQLHVVEMFRQIDKK